MRVLSWNVNGIRSAEKHGFAGWMTAESADVVCLQEVRARPEQLSKSLLEIYDKKNKKYFTCWASAKKPGYSGVAIYSKVEPDNVETFGIPEFDNEGRFIQAEFKNITVISAYFPNSQDGGKRLDYKIAFCGAMLKHCAELVKSKKNFVLSGDYNIAHTPIDLARPKENEMNPGYLPEERAWMDKFTGSGFIDVFRHLHPGETDHYTWWSYKTNARERNVGWRIDYNCINSDFLPAVKSAVIRSEVMGSDHCPVEIDFKL